MYPAGLNDCPFCSVDRGRILLESEHALAFPDGFPIADGHTLVMPRRHVTSVYELTAPEQADAWALVGKVRDLLASEYKPDGFNIGLNDGSAAGQTIMHAHIHIIPRWHGDVPDPRGGVRLVIPARARYWEK